MKSLSSFEFNKSKKNDTFKAEEIQAIDSINE